MMVTRYKISFTFGCWEVLYTTLDYVDHSTLSLYQFEKISRDTQEILATTRRGLG